METQTQETTHPVQQEQAKGLFRFVLWVMLLALAALCLFSAFLTLITGFAQVGTAIKEKNGTSVFLNGTDCGDSPLSGNRPFRWTMEALPDQTLSCPWPGGASAWRSIVCFVCIGVFAILAVGLFKGENLIVWIFTGALGVTAVLFFIAMIVDANSLRKGSSFCHEEMPGAPFLPELKIGKSFRIDCAQGPFVGLVLADVLCIFSCAGMTVFMFFYMRMLGKTSIAPVKKPSSDAERVPIISDEARPDLTTPSALADASLPQDPTAGFNPFDPKSATAAQAQH